LSPFVVPTPIFPAVATAAGYLGDLFVTERLISPRPSVNHGIINWLIISQRFPIKSRISIIIVIIQNLLMMLIASALTPHGPAVSTGSVCRTGTRFYQTHTTNDGEQQ
jgi:hypothetical protein